MYSAGYQDLDAIAEMTREAETDLRTVLVIHDHRTRPAIPVDMGDAEVAIAADNPQIVQQDQALHRFVRNIPIQGNHIN